MQGSMWFRSSNNMEVGHKHERRVSGTMIDPPWPSYHLENIINIWKGGRCSHGPQEAFDGLSRVKVQRFLHYNLSSWSNSFNSVLGWRWCSVECFAGQTPISPKIRRHLLIPPASFWSSFWCTGMVSLGAQGLNALVLSFEAVFESLDLTKSSQLPACLWDISGFIKRKGVRIPAAFF